MPSTQIQYKIKNQPGKQIYEILWNGEGDLNGTITIEVFQNFNDNGL